jgi:hypothetical protein
MLAATPSFPHLKRTKRTGGFAKIWCAQRWGFHQQSTGHGCQDNKSDDLFEQAA